jgi:hypothetical protein
MSGRTYRIGVINSLPAFPFLLGYRFAAALQVLGCVDLGGRRIIKKTFWEPWLGVFSHVARHLRTSVEDSRSTSIIADVEVRGRSQLTAGYRRDQDQLVSILERPIGVTCQRADVLAGYRDKTTRRELLIVAEVLRDQA